MQLLIKVDDVSTPALRSLILLHVGELCRIVPSESCDILDISSLQAKNVTLYSAWDGAGLLGCGALKELSPTHGQIKSMRTVAASLGKGVGRAILQHLIKEAKARGYTRLSLETGKDCAFSRAQNLYSKAGFEFCDPYGTLPPCPASHFMTLKLQ